jgi:hypothetical protein
MKFFDRTLYNIKNRGEVPRNERDTREMTSVVCVEQKEEEELRRIIYYNNFETVDELIEYIKIYYGIVQLEIDRTCELTLFNNEPRTLVADEIPGCETYHSVHYYQDEAATVLEFLEKRCAGWSNDSLVDTFPMLVDFKGTWYNADIEISDDGRIFKINKLKKKDIIDAVAELQKERT